MFLQLMLFSLYVIIDVLSLFFSFVFTFFFFFFNDTATTEIYTLSLHDALPIYSAAHTFVSKLIAAWHEPLWLEQGRDRKSTRLNSSHTVISYAVFCLKKKKKKKKKKRNKKNKHEEKLLHMQYKTDKDIRDRENQ